MFNNIKIYYNNKMPVSRADSALFSELAYGMVEEGGRGKSFCGTHHKSLLFFILK